MVEDRRPLEWCLSLKLHAPRPIAPPVVNSPAASAVGRPTPLPSDADTVAPQPFHFPDEMAEDSDSTVRAAFPLSGPAPVGASAGGPVPTAVVRPVSRLPPPAASDVERPDSGSLCCLRPLRLLPCWIPWPP